MSCSRQDPARRRWRGLPYFLRGFLAVLQTDPAAARPALAASREPARDAGQPSLLAQSLAMASIAANMVGDRTAARRLLDESAGRGRGHRRSLRMLVSAPGSSARTACSRAISTRSEPRRQKACVSAERQVTLYASGDAAHQPGQRRAARRASFTRHNRSSQKRCGSATRSTTGWRSTSCSIAGLPCRRLRPGTARGAAARGR